MFPGHQAPCPYPPASAARMFSHQQQQSPSDSSMSGYGGNNRFHEASVKEKALNGPSVHKSSIASANHSCENSSDMPTINENSGKKSNPFHSYPVV
jgi:hypothetical protein